MKQEQTQTMPNGRERSSASDAETSVIPGSPASFFFHPVTRIYGLLLLLSSFTHTHVYARAPAYGPVCAPGVGKEVRSLSRPFPAPRRRDVWPTLGRSQVAGVVGQPRAASRHVATRWPTARLPKWHGQTPADDRPIGTTRKPGQGEASGNSRQLRDGFIFGSEVSREVL